MNAAAATCDLVITRTFNAPVEQAWSAWIDPERIMRWWGPIGFTCPTAKVDFREGGTSLVCMSSPRFGDMYSTWRYVKIEPMARMEFIHNLADSEGNTLDPAALGMPPDFPRDQRQTVTFTALADGGTEMTVTEHGWTEGRMMEMARQGLGECLDKMAAIFTEA